MSTFLEIASDSLTEIGQLGTGQSIGPEQAQLCLRVGNRMLGKWSAKRLYLYNVPSVPFLLISGQQDYTVGPTGLFVQDRPVFVQAAQVQPAFSNSLALPLNMLDSVQWGAIRDKGATCSANGVPQDIWPEYTFPNLTFHLWTIPSNACKVYLAVWVALTKFATVFDTFSFPEGYEEAVIHNLSMELCPSFDMPVPDSIGQLAVDGLATIQGINAQALGGALGESQTLQSPNVATPPPQGAR